MFEVVGEAEISPRDSDVFEREPAGFGQHEEFSEAGDGIGDLGDEGLVFLFDLDEGFSGEPAVEGALDRVVEDFEDVGELEDELAGFELLEAECALGEGFEAGDGEEGGRVEED